MFYITVILNIFIFVNINTFLAVDWLFIDKKYISNVSLIFLLFVSLFSTLFVPYRRNLFDIAGSGLTYLIFLYSRLLGMFVKDQNLIVFVYSYLIIAICIGVIWICSQMFKLSILAKLTRPISETLFVFALVLIWFKSNVNSSELSIVYVTSTVYYFVRSLILKSEITRVVSYFLLLVSYALILLVLDQNKIIELNSTKYYSLAFLLPSIIFSLFLNSKITLNSIDIPKTLP